MCVSCKRSITIMQNKKAHTHTLFFSIFTTHTHTYTELFVCVIVILCS